MEWIPWIIAGANAVASIFWGAKFQRASDRLVAAKDAQITRLESEIKSLERLSPPVLKDWLEASQNMAQVQVEGKDREIAILKEQIEGLRNEHLSRTQLIDQLESLVYGSRIGKAGFADEVPSGSISI